MAKAICLKCGNYKTAAFADCPKCGFDPAANDADKETQAKSLLLSDQLASKKDLERMSKDIQQGKALHFDTQKVLGLVDQLQTQKISISKGPPAAVAAAWLPWAFAAALGGAVAFWLFKLR